MKTNKNIYAFSYGGYDKNVYIKLCIANSVCWIILSVLFYYLLTPAFSSVGFIIFVGFILSAIGGINLAICSKTNLKNIVSKILFVVGLLSIVGIIVAELACSHIFHAKAYADLADIEVSEDLTEIPTLDEVDHISLMDTKSASKLGDRQLGQMQELVSQFEVSSIYYTITYQGKIYKIAPLEYGGFFKWVNNDCIPGYVLVDPSNNSAAYVKIEGGMKYSPSAYFQENMKRHVQLAYPTVKLAGGVGYTNAETEYSEYSFQLDEDGKPYWVLPTIEYEIGVGYEVINGAILVNAQTGSMERYASADLPDWVDLVYCGPYIENIYDEHGEYLNGIFNFSKKGETMVTDDFGYMMVGEDICIYTGVTSVSNDESNVAFIIANTRTGKIKYYAIAGAEEYSAMSAAKGIVQNYGYTASFPSLVIVEDEPTYVMVLKDSAGLIKMYSMVNMKNYTIAVVGDDLGAAKKAYIKALKGGTAGSVEDADLEVITGIKYSTADGKVYVTITYANGTETTALFEESENIE